MGKDMILSVSSVLRLQKLYKELDWATKGGITVKDRQLYNGLRDSTIKFVMDVVKPEKPASSIKETIDIALKYFELYPAPVSKSNKLVRPIDFKRPVDRPTRQRATQSEVQDWKIKSDIMMKERALVNPQGNFYRTDEWRKLRSRVLSKYKAVCMCCGRSYVRHAVVIHVDHIKPRSLYPELELDFDNCQVLCIDCNMGKGNTDETDWRPVKKSSEVKSVINRRVRGVSL